MQLPTVGRVARSEAAGRLRRRPFGSVLLPEHCAGLHCVQMLLGSASMPRAVLVELDDIQRRLLASRPAGQETSQESSGQADENAELTAWQKARIPQTQTCALSLHARLPGLLVHVPCRLAGGRRCKGSGAGCLSAQG